MNAHLKKTCVHRVGVTLPGNSNVLLWYRGEASPRGTQNAHPMGARQAGSGPTRFAHMPVVGSAAQRWPWRCRASLARLVPTIVGLGLYTSLFYDGKMTLLGERRDFVTLRVWTRAVVGPTCGCALHFFKIRLPGRWYGMVWYQPWCLMVI